MERGCDRLWAVVVAVCVGVGVVGCPAPDGGSGDEGAAAPDSSSSDSGGVPGAEDRCEPDAGACGGEGKCDAYECGGRAAVYNHFGCSRVACGADADCPAGEGCFARVYESSCLPSVIDCAEDDGQCACAASDDCDGILGAHCLPNEFYPQAAYCDVTGWGCDALGPWRDALDRASTHHAAEGRDELAKGLADCAQLAGVALGDCEGGQ